MDNDLGSWPSVEGDEAKKLESHEHYALLSQAEDFQMGHRSWSCRVWLYQSGRTIQIGLGFVLSRKNVGV